MWQKKEKNSNKITTYVCTNETVKGENIADGSKKTRTKTTLTQQQQQQQQN